MFPSSSPEPVRKGLPVRAAHDVERYPVHALQGGEGLQRALGLLEAGDADALLITHLDRLTRRLADLLYLMENHFSDGKAALLSVNDNIDTSCASGQLVLNVLGAVIQWERQAIGERTRQAMARKRQNREYTGGKVPYGWKVAPDGKMLVADEHEQAGILMPGADFWHPAL